MIYQTSLYQNSTATYRKMFHVCVYACTSKRLTESPCFDGESGFLLLMKYYKSLFVSVVSCIRLMYYIVFSIVWDTRDEEKRRSYCSPFKK